MLEVGCAERSSREEHAGEHVEAGERRGARAGVGQLDPPLEEPRAVALGADPHLDGSQGVLEVDPRAAPVGFGRREAPPVLQGLPVEDDPERGGGHVHAERGEPLRVLDAAVRRPLHAGELTVGEPLGVHRQRRDVADLRLG